MPALRLLGRRWNVATDDLPLVALWPTLFHGCWSIILFAAWLALDKRSNCDPGGRYKVALAGLGVSFFVNFIVGSWITVESLRGTIFETHIRWKVPWLLYIFFLVFITELGFLIYGTIIMQQAAPACLHTDRHIWSPHGVMQVMIYSTWGIFGLAFAFTFLAYNAFPDHSSRSSWERRCWCLTAVCCCQWRRGWTRDREKQEKEPYARLAELFLQLFGHTDLVASDILAAFLMVAEWQREQRQATVNQLLTGDTSDDNDDDYYHKESEGPFKPRRRSLSEDLDQEGDDESCEGDATGRAQRRRSHHADKGVGHSRGLDREESSTSRDPLWANSSSESRSYESVNGSGREGDERVDSSEAAVQDNLTYEGNSECHASAQELEERASPRKATLLTPSGIVAQIRPEWVPVDAAGRQVEEASAVSDEEVHLASHYCNFAFAAYGYMLYIWSQPRQGCLYLCCGRWCSLWTGPLRRYAEAFAAQRFLPDLYITNHMNHEAILQMAGLKEKDLAFVRFQGEGMDPKCLPYFVAVDHETHNVVLAIRGTLSLDDCLTDFMCEPADLEEWIVSAKPGGLKELGRDPHRGTPGMLRKPMKTLRPGRRHHHHDDNLGDARTSAPDTPTHTAAEPSSERNPPNSFAEDAPAVQLATRDTKTTAHAGMLDAAKAIVDDLKHVGVLEALLTGERKAGKHKVHHDCRGWGIVVTGHSLGAGASVLVTLYLRNYFQSVKCWAFEPPGGVADPYIAEATKGFCTSCILGKDWIPRLTVATFERLRDEMITAAATCKRNKTQFLVGAFLGRKHRQKMRAEGRSLFRQESELDPSVQRVLADWRHSVLGTRSQQNRYHMARSFIPPGRLLFLRPVKASTRNEAASKRQYQPVWIQPEALMREGILVSPRMMADHMPDYLTAVLRKMARSRGCPTTTSGTVTLNMEDCDQGDPERSDH